MRERARLWSFDAGMERLLVLKTEDAAGYARLSPTLKIALGFYLSSKEAAVTAANR